MRIQPVLVALGPSTWNHAFGADLLYVFALFTRMFGPESGIFSILFVSDAHIHLTTLRCT